MYNYMYTYIYIHTSLSTLARVLIQHVGCIVRTDSVTMSVKHFVGLPHTRIPSRIQLYACLETH